MLLRDPWAGDAAVSRDDVRKDSAAAEVLMDARVQWVPHPVRRRRCRRQKFAPAAAGEMPHA